MRRTLVGVATAALLLGSGVLFAAGVSITVTHDLDAARPASVIAVPFHEIDAIAPGLRMYHVIVRDPKGRALPLQITNYQHDHHGAKYDDLVFSYDFEPGEQRAVFTLEAGGHGDAARSALCVRTPRAGALRRHGLGKRPHRASHVRHGAQWTRGRRGRRKAARQRHRRLGQAGHLPDRRSLVRQGPRPVPPGRRRRRSRSLQHRRDARRRRHRDLGWHQALDLGQFRAARRSSRMARGAPYSDSSYAPWDAGAAGKIEEVKQFTVDCGRNFDMVESTFKFAKSTGGCRHRHHRSSAVHGIPGRRAHPRPRRPTG